MEALGRIMNIVHEASGVHIYLRDGEAITFSCYEADGSQVLTLRESIAGASEQTLAVIAKIYRAPGIGGTWTEVTQTAAATFDNDDNASDCVVFTVHASQLSDTFNCLELTTDEGSGLGVVAIIHDLTCGGLISGRLLRGCLFGGDPAFRRRGLLVHTWFIGPPAAGGQHDRH